MLTWVLLLVPTAPPQPLSFSPLSWIQGTTVVQRGDERETKADSKVLAQLILHKPTWSKDHGASREPLAEPSLLHWEHSPAWSSITQ